MAGTAGASRRPEAASLTGGAVSGVWAGDGVDADLGRAAWGDR